MPFIRRGGWCSTCSKSWNPVTSKMEAGLSPFECKPAGAKKWQAFGKAWENFTKAKRINNAARPWVLIDGKHVGSPGGDGEPLISSPVFISALRRINGSDIFEEVEGAAPPPSNHPVDANGNCYDKSIYDDLDPDDDADDESTQE